MHAKESSRRAEEESKKGHSIVAVATIDRRWEGGRGTRAVQQATYEALVGVERQDGLQKLGAGFQGLLQDTRPGTEQ